MQIVVLGMHRSGTSAVARVLNLAGAYFGAEGIGTPPNAENRKGFWEREDVRVLNDAVLHAMRCDWDVVADFNIAAIPKRELTDLHNRAAEIVTKLDAHRPWFIKEPRLCLLLPLWRQLLEFPVCVHIYRNPLEVAKSLKARNEIPLPAGLALWEAYNVSALTAADGLPRVFISYNDLMEKPVDVVANLLARLSDYGGYPLRRPVRNELVAFLSARLHHQQANVTALRKSASEAQVKLFMMLQDLRGKDLRDSVPTLPLSRTASEALREYESQRRDIATSVRDANAARLRRQQVDSTTQLILKSHELDRALGDLEQTKREIRRLQEQATIDGSECAKLKQQLAVRDEQVRNLTSQRQELAEEVPRLAAARQDERRDLHDSLRELGAAKEEVARLAAARQDERRDLDDSLRELGAAKEEVARLAAARQDERRDLDDSLRELGAAKEEVARLAAARQDERRDLDDSLRELGAAKEEVARLAAARQDERRDLDDSLRELGAAKEEVARLAAARQDERRDLDDSLRELGAAKEEVARLAAARQDERRDLDDSLRELGAAKEEVARLAAARQDERRDLDDSLRELGAAKEEVARLAAARQDERRDLDDSLRELGVAKDETKRQISVAAKLRQELDEVRRKNRELQREKNALLHLAGHLRVGVKALLATRRWRFGHAVLSLPYRLRLRAPPATAAETLLRLTEDPLPTVSRAIKPPAADAKDASRRPTAERTKPRRTTVAVLAWDVGHNPYGRAYLLAEALSRQYRVVLIGFQFPRYGSDVWAPLRGAPIEPVILPGKNFPAFQQQLESLAAKIDPDVVIACKARLPTVQLGLMLKAVRNRPLIVDVDDYELSFFANRQPLESVADLPAETLQVPHEEAWTRRIEPLLPFADELLVSNPTLQSKFGGVVVPHARDEHVFDPGKVAGAVTRRQLGFKDQDRLVFFVGTPRPHKGLLELVSAIRASGVEDCSLVVVGTPPDKSFGNALLHAGGDRLTMLADQPFEALPGLLAAADLVCLLPDPESAISRFQLPAKLIDALAMGVPVLATATQSIENLVAAGLVHTASREAAATAIRDLLTMSRDERQRRALQARRWFLQNGSYQAILRDLSAVIERTLESPKTLHGAARQFLQEQESRFCQRQRSLAPRQGIDIVMFWKQNDVGLYGRRFEMIVTYLRERADIGHIAVFEPPVPDRAFATQRPPTDQSGLIAHMTLLRSWRLMDVEKVSYHAYRDGSQIHSDGSPVAYEDYVAAELDSIGVEPSQAVFWHYPYFKHTMDINARLQPRLNVVDVVDDQRTWANSDAAWLERVDQHYREVLGSADVVFANCTKLQRSMAKIAKVTVVPNGCDTRPAPVTARDFRFRQFAALQKPIIGLVGNLEPKTDSALLRKLATERPDYQLAFIGSTHSAEADLLRLRELPNVTFFGVVTYPEVRAWISQLDVALVPHRDTEQTRAMHPLKVLAYAADSIPVVTTQIENLGEFRPFMRVASSHADFVAGVDEVLDGRFTLDKQALLTVVQRNSWDRRVDEMMTEIAKKLL